MLNYINIFSILICQTVKRILNKLGIKNTRWFIGV